MKNDLNLDLDERIMIEMLIEKVRDPEYIRIKELAKQYETIAEFFMKEREAYNRAAEKRVWFRDITAHMKRFI